MPERRPRVLFYFLHLLGVGHVHRAQKLIAAMARAGIAVDVIYGGEPLDGIGFDADSLHFLPPIKASDASFARMLDADGKALSEEYLMHRQAVLLDVVYKLHPDAILIETFPFGRRVVRQEILAMIAAARERARPPLIVSSVRDILQERRKPGRAEETRDWVINHFDHVLVHSDPEITRLHDTFPLAGEIASWLSYTGYVVPPAEVIENVPSFDVIVSAGGGAFGAELMQAAFELAKERSDLTWCFSTGPNSADDILGHPRENRPQHIEIVGRLDHFAAHLRKAGLSISQCGYNTAMDVLSAQRNGKCRSVFVPYDLTGQTEQLRRAQLLEKAGYAVCLPQSELTKERLNAAMEKALALPKVDRDVDFDGAAKSAVFIKGWIEARG